MTEICQALSSPEGRRNIQAAAESFRHGKIVPLADRHVKHMLAMLAQTARDTGQNCKAINDAGRKSLMCRMFGVRSNNF